MKYLLAKRQSNKLLFKFMGKGQLTQDLIYQRKYNLR